ATIDNSTITNNGGFYGGGVDAYGDVTITNSTIADNNVSGSGAGLSIGGTLTLKNSIVADNGTKGGYADVDGVINSQGYNLIGNTSGGSGFDPTDLQNVSPNLGSLQNNGGATSTRALLLGSP